MIPLGVLASARHSAAGGPGARAYIGQYPDEVDRSVYTYSVPVGAAASKTIVVAGTGRLNATNDLSGVTVGGSALTIDEKRLYINNGVGFIGHVTKATSASEDIVVSYTATMLRAAIAVWTIDGPISLAGTYSANVSANGDWTFTVPAADHVIAYTTNGDDNPSTWTGATKRFDGPAGTGVFWWHSGADGETANPSASATRGIVNSILVAASYDNA